MELVFVTMLICTILISTLLTPCTASLQIQVLQQSNKQPANNLVQVSVPALPRKLRFTEKVTVVGVQDQRQDSTTSNKHKENVLGGKPIFHKEDEEEEEGDVQVMQRSSRSGTRQEWVEEDTSQFFSMDYSRVRRRRPIHNKSLPVAP